MKMEQDSESKIAELVSNQELLLKPSKTLNWILTILFVCLVCPIVISFLLLYFIRNVDNLFMFFVFFIGNLIVIPIGISSILSLFPNHGDLMLTSKNLKIISPLGKPLIFEWEKISDFSIEDVGIIAIHFMYQENSCKVKKKLTSYAYSGINLNELREILIQWQNKVLQIDK